MTLFKDCPGSKRIKTPYPEEIKCSCGQMVEIWSDESITVCKRCKKEVTREMLPSCLDWCSMAKQCVGDQKYNRYLQSKKKKGGKGK
jgi:hypothetical protein